MVLGIINIAGGAIGAVCSTIGGAIGGAVGSFASVIGGLFPEIALGKLFIDLIGAIVNGIAEILGIGNKEEKLDELGAKATQPDTKKSEEFSSTEEYIKYLREEVKLDQERFDKMSPEEKLANQLAGTAIITKGIEEKTGTKIPAEFLVNSAKLKLSYEETKAYIDAFKSNGINDMGIMTNYLSGKGDGLSNDISKKSISEAMQTINPEMSKESIEEKIFEMKKETCKY